MANVKRGLAAPKSAPKTGSRRKRKVDGRTVKALKSLRTVIAIENKNKIVKKPRVADDKLYLLTPDEKVQYLLRNGHQLKDAFDIKKTTNTGRPKVNGKKSNTKSVTKSSADNKLLSPKRTSSRVKQSNNKFQENIDNITKKDACVIPGSKRTRSSTSAESSSNGANNNNNNEITNQNKTNNQNKTSNQNKISERNRKKACVIDSCRPSNKITEDNNVVNKSKCSKKEKAQIDIADESKSPTQPEKVVKPRKYVKRHLKFYQSRDTIRQEFLVDGVVVTLPVYQCDYCGKTFHRKHSLVRHIYLHLGRRPFICPVCPKKFRIRKNMDIHLDRDHCIKEVEVTETYSCDTCDKPFLTKENLILHLRSHVKGENSFKCIYCDKKFSYQLLLVQHEKKHLVTGKYQCTLCDVKFKSRDKLYVHVKSHLKLADYICQYCGREFLRSNSMKRHIQTMHAGRTIQCPICNKKLKGHLTEHMRTHDKKRPHMCTDCGKQFTQSTQLKVHLRCHTGTRPYMCRICERPFTHSNALMLHLRRHTGEKPFPCAECPLSFSQLPHMKAHMYKIHGKENPYKCLKCENYFKLKKDLLVHKKTCNGTGIDTDLYGDNRIPGESSEDDPNAPPVASTMSLSRMRFLLALLLTMIANKKKLKYLANRLVVVCDDRGVTSEASTNALLMTCLLSHWKLWIKYLAKMRLCHRFCVLGRTLRRY